MPHDHRAVMDRYLTAFKKGDMETVVELTHPECVISEPDSLPYGGEYTGKNAFRDMFGTVLSTWDTVEFEENHILGEDDVFAVLGDVRFQNEPAGSVETHVVEVCELEDGLIRGLTIYYEDTAAIIDQLE